MYHSLFYKTIYILSLFCLFACNQENKTQAFYSGTDDIKAEKAFLMEITNPAGSGSDHAFLPYPVNYGFFTEDTKLEIVTIMNQLEKGTQVAVYPIATLVLKEAGQERSIVVTTPLDTALQIIPIMDYQNFLVEQIGPRQIIQDWFLYEKGLGKVDLVGWKEESYAWKLLKGK